MQGFMEKRDMPLRDVECGREEERAGENHRHGKDRSGAGGSDDNDKQGDPVRNGECPEMPGCVGVCGVLFAEEEVRQCEEEDLDGDKAEQNSDDSPPRCPFGERVEFCHPAGQIGHIGRVTDKRAASQGLKIGAERTARGARTDMGVKQARVDRRVLAIHLGGDGGHPTIAFHVSRVARHGRSVPGDF
jgi:hypothetical protein